MMTQEVKHTLLRLPVDIHVYLVQKAKRERLPLHTLIVRILDQDMQQEGRATHE